jgi:hypothetical protein
MEWLHSKKLHSYLGVGFIQTSGRSLCMVAEIVWGFPQSLNENSVMAL